MLDFTNFDGTGRPPRKVQVQALSWLQETWEEAEVFGLNAPCGVGKSGIGRAVQIATNGAYLAPENILVKQILDTYPGLNHLIGRKHYTCHKDKAVSCEDKHLLKSHTVCDKCIYMHNRIKAVRGEPTVFNPVSYYYASITPGWKIPEVIVVDEADQLLDTISLISGEEFGAAYKPPADMSIIDVVEWLGEQERMFMKIVMMSEERKAIRYNMILQKIRRVRECVISSPEQYMHFYKDGGTLVVHPLTPPKKLRDSLLASKKLVLMSASLLKIDISRLTDRPYRYIELDSPIPEERRRIHIEPGPIRFNWETQPVVIAEWIKQKVKQNPGKNTIVHVSYALSEKLASYCPGYFTNTPETKIKVLDKFKKSGGIWLASGIAKGVDLPGDMCTLNLIPLLPRPNIEDTIVRKKLA